VCKVANTMCPVSLFVRVTLGPNYLYGLRELIYDHSRKHVKSSPHMDGFQHLRRDNVEYKEVVQGDGDVGRLLQMTPYYWQASREQQARVLALPELELDVDFCVDVFRCRVE